MGIDKAVVYYHSILKMDKLGIFRTFVTGTRSPKNTRSLTLPSSTVPKATPFWYLSLPLPYHSPIEQHALYYLTHRNFHIHTLVLLTTRKRSTQTQSMAELTQLRCKQNPGVSWANFDIMDGNSFQGENRWSIYLTETKHLTNSFFAHFLPRPKQDKRSNS